MQLAPVGRLSAGSQGRHVGVSGQPGAEAHRLSHSERRCRISGTSKRNAGGSFCPQFLAWLA